MRLVEAGWDADVARRPHGQHTTVVAHLDVNDKAAQLHLGPLLSDADRQYLTCDATCEVWFQRHGQPIGAGRSTRAISRRLRRALEHRHPTCAVPGCGATRGLHAHHIVHWEDGGPTELYNLVLLRVSHESRGGRVGGVVFGCAACGQAEIARWSLSRLCTVQIRRHSLCTPACPRRENLRNPRFALMLPKTGSMLTARLR